MGERHALVIGANDYPGNQLINAVNDASKVAEALEKRGFSVSLVIDPTGGAVDRALAAFRTAAADAKLAIIYLAGHAVERHGSGFFLPIDFEFPLTASRLRHTAVPLNSFVDAMDQAASRILVLDACRNWPIDPDDVRRASQDLEELSADERNWPNLLLAYATSSTRTAADGSLGHGSAFSRSLCTHLLDHSLTVDECFRRVSQDVVAHRREQQPWTYSSLANAQSFTDLPRFSVIQRHATPNPQRLGLLTWTTIGKGRRHVVVGVGDGLAWRVGVGGFEQVRHQGDDRLMGGAEVADDLYLVGSEGALYAAGRGNKAVLHLDATHSHGLATSPAHDGFVHYGAGAVDCLMVNSGIHVVSRHDVGFDVFCCVYLPDGLVWIGGDGGVICELDPRDPDKPIREVTRVRTHVNAMVVAPDGNRVFIVGQGGLALELDRSGNELKELLPKRPLKTAAGIRARLHHLAEDEVIRRFIFDPSSLSEEIIDLMNEHLTAPNYLACSTPPNLPMLAVATEESSVVLLDTRDGQIVQEFDVGSGNSAIVSGVHFLSDRGVVVIGGHGEVTFLGA